MTPAAAKRAGEEAPNAVAIGKMVETSVRQPPANQISGRAAIGARVRISQEVRKWIAFAFYFEELRRKPTQT